MKKIVVIAVLLSTALFSYAFIAPDKPTGYVNDYANILSVNVKQFLEEELRNFTASSSNEIAVVTIPDLGGDTIENYAVKLFESWKIGDVKNDNGILLLISRDDRKLRIEVGYGLEGVLPDIIAKDIIDNKIVPLFKQGDYDNGVIEGVKAIEEVTKGEYQVMEENPGLLSSINGNTIEFIVVFLIFVVQFLSAILARSKSWWAGGLIGGIGGVAVTYFGVLGVTLIGGSIITIIFILIGLVFDYFVSNTYKSAVSGGSSIPWWAGGAGRSSSNGSSFGGFGGGSSGGGGASGSW